MLFRRIRELREAQNLTRRQMAALLRISPSTYARYERGNTDPPLEVLRALAVLHHTSLDYIAGLTDQQIPHKRTK